MDIKDTAARMETGAKDYFEGIMEEDRDDSPRIRSDIDADNIVNSVTLYEKFIALPCENFNLIMDIIDNSNKSICPPMRFVHSLMNLSPAEMENVLCIYDSAYAHLRDDDDNEANESRVEYIKNHTIDWNLRSSTLSKMILGLITR